MMMYYQDLHEMENDFYDLEYLHILRGHNEVIDELGKLSSSWAGVP
jgi:hypothetical protein